MLAGMLVTDSVAGGAPVAVQAAQTVQAGLPGMWAPQAAPGTGPNE